MSTKDNELRFQRIEDKVDDLKVDVTEIKIDMKHHMDKVEEHITGDKKIINEISPLLEKLPGLVEIVEDHAYAKRVKAERKEKAAEIGKRIGFVSMCIGIIAGIAKIVAVI